MKRIIIFIPLMLLLFSCSSNIDSLFLKVGKLENKKEYDIAIKVLEEYKTKKNPNDEELYLIDRRLAEYYIELENNKNAVRLLLKSIEISIKIDNQNLLWDSTKLIMSLIHESNYKLDNHDISDFVSSTFSHIAKLETLETIHLNIGLSIAKYFENKDEISASVKTYLNLYHLMDKEKIENKKTLIFIYSNLARLYSKSGQISDAISIEKMRINELISLDSNIINDKNEQILISLYHLVTYNDYIEAQKYLEKLYNYFESSSTSYEFGIYYQIYADLENILNKEDTHSIYIKSINLLKKAKIIDENIYSVIIKDSMYLYRRKEFNEIEKNYLLFNEIYNENSKNKYIDKKEEMENIMLNSRKLQLQN